MIDEALSEFLSETNEAFNVLDIAMYRDDGEGIDPGLLDYVCRFVYRIKGNCGFLDLTRLGALADASAEFVRQASEDEAEPTPQANELLLRSLDGIKFILGALEGEGVEPEGDDKELIRKLNLATAAQGRRRRRKSKTSPAESKAKSERPPRAAAVKKTPSPEPANTVDSNPEATNETAAAPPVRAGELPSTEANAAATPNAVPKTPPVEPAGEYNGAESTALSTEVDAAPGGAVSEVETGDAPSPAHEEETVPAKAARPAPTAQSRRKPKDRSKPSSEAAAKTASKAKTQSKSEPGPEPKAQPKAKSAPKVKAKAQPKAKSEPKAKAKAQPKTKSKASMAPKARSRSVSRARSKSEPKPTAESPPRRRQSTPRANIEQPVADIAARSVSAGSDIIDPTMVLVMAPEIGDLEQPSLSDAKPNGAGTSAPAAQMAGRVGDIEAMASVGAPPADQPGDRETTEHDDVSTAKTGETSAAVAAKAAPASRDKSPGKAKTKASEKTKERKSVAASEPTAKKAGKPPHARKGAKATAASGSAKSTRRRASKPKAADAAAKPVAPKAARKTVSKGKTAKAPAQPTSDTDATATGTATKPSRSRQMPAPKSAAKKAPSRRKRGQDTDAAVELAAASMQNDSSIEPTDDAATPPSTEAVVAPVKEPIADGANAVSAAPEPAVSAVPVPSEETPEEVGSEPAAADTTLKQDDAPERAADLEAADAAVTVSETGSPSAEAEQPPAASAAATAATPEPERPEDDVPRPAKRKRPKRMISQSAGATKPKTPTKRVPSRMVIVPPTTDEPPEAARAANCGPEATASEEAAPASEAGAAPTSAAEEATPPAARARRPRRIVEPGKSAGNGSPPRARGRTNGGAGRTAAKPTPKSHRVVGSGSGEAEAPVPLAAEAPPTPSKKSPSRSKAKRPDAEKRSRASATAAASASAAVETQPSASGPMLEPVPVAPDPSSSTVPCALVIFNPSAGWRRRRRFSRTLHHLQGMGFDLTVRETDGPGDAERLAAEAVRDGIYDLVIAAGGDGTINEIISGLAGSQIPLGIMPLGTANVLAAEVGLHAEPVEVATIISAGMARPIYLGRVDKSRHFALMAGVGFDARVVQKVGPLSKRLFGKLAFVWRIMVEVLRGRQQTYVVSVDGTQFTASSVIVANGRFYGGRYVCAPEARLTDPTLHVVLFERSGRWSVLRYLLAARAGKLAQRPDVRIVQAASVSIEGPAGDPVQADGEIVGVLPTKISVSGVSLPLLQPE